MKYHLDGFAFSAQIILFWLCATGCTNPPSEQATSSQTRIQKVVSEVESPNTELPTLENYRQLITQLRPDGEELTYTFLSPDGHYLAVANGEYVGWPIGDANDLYMLQYRDRRIRRLTQDSAGYPYVAWSPDSQRLAFMSRSGAIPRLTGSGIPSPLVPWTVYVQDVRQTAQRRQLFQEQPSSADWRDHLLEWLPDGKALLYNSDRPSGLFLLTVAGKRPVLLTADRPEAVWVKERFACWLSEDRLRLTTAELPAEASLLTQPTAWKALERRDFSLPGQSGGFTLSPDGHRIAFRSLLAEAARNNEAVYHLIVLERASGEMRALGTMRDAIPNLVWSPDGRALRWEVHRNQQPTVRLLVDVDTTPARKLRQIDWRQTRPVQAIQIPAS